MSFSYKNPVPRIPDRQDPITIRRSEQSVEDDNLSQASSEDLYLEPTENDETSTRKEETLPALPPRERIPQTPKHVEESYEEIPNSTSPSKPPVPPRRQFTAPNVDSEERESYEEIDVPPEPTFTGRPPVPLPSTPHETQNFVSPTFTGRPPVPLPSTPHETQNFVSSEYVMDTENRWQPPQRTISVTSQPGYSPEERIPPSPVMLRQKSEGAEPNGPQPNTILPEIPRKKVIPGIANDQPKLVNTIVLRNTRANLKPISDVFKKAQNEEVQDASVDGVEHQGEQNVLQQIASRRLTKPTELQSSQQERLQQSYRANRQDSSASSGGSVSGWRKASKDQPLPTTPTETSAEAPERVENERWYFQIERNEVDDKLQRTDGMFLVRPSKRGGPDAPYTLCVYHNDRVYNLNIRYRTDKKYALGTPFANESTFDTVSDLINYYHRNPIKLVDSKPVQLVNCPLRDDIYDQTM